MQITHLTLIFLSVTSIYGHPTKPLDERSTELTWQAWFLVQNNDTEGATRKKVVPKSVFIAPEFDRPCPEGEQRDIAGNCIKLYGLDAEGQLDFLFAKLSQHFDAAKSDEVQNQATPGPAQIHLPIPLRASGPVDDVVDGLTLVDPGKGVDEEVEANPATEAPPTSTTDLPEEAASTVTVTIITERPVRREAPPAVPTSTYPTTTWYTTDSPTTSTAEQPDSSTVATTTTSAAAAATDSTTTGTGRYAEAETTSSTTSGSGDEATGPYDERTTDVGPIAFRLPVYGDDDVRHAAHTVRFPGEVFESYARPERDRQRYGHRNRDKNIWRFNPPWRETPDTAFVIDDADSYRKLLHEQLSYLLRKNR